MVAGLIVLGHARLATAMSVLFVGWVTLIAGVVALVAAVLRTSKDGSRLTAINGGLLASCCCCSVGCACETPPGSRAGEATHTGSLD